MDDKRAARMVELIKPFLAKPGRPVVLERDFDPGYTMEGVEKEDSDELLQKGVEYLREYQARLAAQDVYGLLVIIQALDAAGKDGTISHVMSGVNPQGVKVHSFKKPSTLELDHDYLWRCASALPARGDITIFNRSHYEEVLVVRVHPEYLEGERLPASARKNDIWKRRYREINNWERYLFDNGFPVVKLFLNVSKEEQRQRFLDRLDTPEKNWKFSAADAAERKYWDEYQHAFSEMLTHTSTSWAPWYVIPADNKWFARVAAAAVIISALAKIDPQFPKVTDAAKQELIAARAALEAESPNGVTKRRRTAARNDAEEASGAKPKGMTARFRGFGDIELQGKRYQDDVVIAAGEVQKRRKKPSKRYRDQYGHTPLSVAEDIPWGGRRLIVGTGVTGALPVMPEVYEEAERRGAEVVAVPLEEALRLVSEEEREQVFAVLHITC